MTLQTTLATLTTSGWSVSLHTTHPDLWEVSIFRTVQLPDSFPYQAHGRARDQDITIALTTAIALAQHALAHPHPIPKPNEPAIDIIGLLGLTQPANLPIITRRR